MASELARDQFGGARAVEHAAALLLALAQTEGGGVRELARQLDIPKSTAQRILTSLQRSRLVDFDPARTQYRLGPGVLELAAGYREHSDLVSVAAPYLLAVRDAVQETVAVSMRIDDVRITLWQVESPMPLRLSMPPGMTYPLQTGATGRAVLAQLDDSTVQEIVKGPWRLARVVPNDESRRALLDAVATTRDRGYAVSREEWIAGGGAVSVPLWLAEGPAAAITIYAPLTRMSDSAVDEWAATLKRAAAAIAVDLGQTRPFEPRLPEAVSSPTR